MNFDEIFNLLNTTYNNKLYNGNNVPILKFSDGTILCTDWSDSTHLALDVYKEEDLENIGFVDPVIRFDIISPDPDCEFLDFPKSVEPLSDSDIISMKTQVVAESLLEYMEENNLFCEFIQPVKSTPQFNSVFAEAVQSFGDLSTEENPVVKAHLVDFDEEFAKKHFATPELKEEAEKLSRMLLDRGFMCWKIHEFNTLTFINNEGFSSAYLGDFHGYRKEDPIEPKFASAYKFIELHEVNKRNGTEHNASLSFNIVVYKGGEPYYFTKTIDGIGEVPAVLPQSMGMSTRWKKFAPGLSDKKREALINGVINEYNNAQICDMTVYDVRNK